MAGELNETRAAFDSVANAYDAQVDGHAILDWMRAHLRAAVAARIPPGAHLLDLGCGTGLDADFLGRRGYRVTAIDWSPEMTARTAGRIAHAGLSERVSVHRLGIHQLADWTVPPFAGIYSDLGPLNCVPDLGVALRAAAAILRPGGWFVASLLGRTCPWEILFFGLQGQWRRARIRYSADAVPVPLNGRRVWTRYHAPREVVPLLRDAGFELRSLRTLGLIVPPPYLLRSIGRRRPFLHALQTIEDRVAGWPGIRQWGDHFLVVARKQA